MLRKSELGKTLEIEQEIGRRRRIGHFGLDAHRATGPQVRVVAEKSKATSKQKKTNVLRAGPFREIEGRSGHIIYKPVKSQRRR